MSTRLDGLVVVTGGGSGIGRATAERIASPERSAAAFELIAKLPGFRGDEVRV